MGGRYESTKHRNGLAHNEDLAAAAVDPDEMVRAAVRPPVALEVRVISMVHHQEAVEAVAAMIEVEEAEDSQVRHLAIATASIAVGHHLATTVAGASVGAQKSAPNEANGGVVERLEVAAWSRTTKTIGRQRTC